MGNPLENATQLFLYLSQAFWCDLDLILPALAIGRPDLQNRRTFMPRENNDFFFVSSHRVDDMAVAYRHTSDVRDTQDLYLTHLQVQHSFLRWSSISLLQHQHKEISHQ